MQDKKPVQPKTPDAAPAEAAEERHPSDAAQRRESGEPGGGQGRRDDVGQTGVHPLSAGLDPNRNAEIRTMAAWGQGDRGSEGYNDTGGSELVMREGQLLGGLTAGPSGEPTIDIHGGDRPSDMPSSQTPSDSRPADDKKNKNKKKKKKP